jgi:hypothetical protein
MLPRIAASGLLSLDYDAKTVATGASTFFRTTYLRTENLGTNRMPSLRRSTKNIGEQAPQSQ